MIIILSLHYNKYMAIIKIKVNIPSNVVVRETKQQRYERVTTAGSDMRTRIVPSKKRLTRSQQKAQDRREHDI